MSFYSDFNVHKTMGTNIANLRAQITGVLIGTYAQLVEKFGNDVSGVYLFGSLVNGAGSGFNRERSDIDLLLTTPLTTAEKRCVLLTNLVPYLRRLEETLMALIKAGEVQRAQRVTSFCLATDFEVSDGIHKNRNTRQAFSMPAFFRLKLPTKNEPPEDDGSPPLESPGGQLNSDLVGVYFSAWTVLADVQAFRSRYLNLNTDSHEGVEGLVFDDDSLVLPKDLLRSAYHYFCLDECKEPAMCEEDDIAVGLDVIKRLARQEAGRGGNSGNNARKILNQLETNRPGGRGESKRVDPEDLLFLWELLGENTELVLCRRRRETPMETLQSAADIVTQELSSFKVAGLKAVDTAIELFRSDELVRNGRVLLTIQRHYDISSYTFTSKNEANLRALAKEWPEDIRTYLETRIAEDGSEHSMCKVGFAGLHYSQTGVARPPSLVVRPLTYWITQQFNKEIAAKRSDANLQRMRAKYAKKLLTCTEDFQCDCPSNLFLELAVVTSDELVPKFYKKLKHSCLGKGNSRPVATCGVEAGFDWQKHIETVDGHQVLNVEKAVFDALKGELKVDSSEVVQWSVNTLAIQHAHLNSALLGIARLKLTFAELMDRAGIFKGEHRYFTEDCVAMSLPNALLAVQVDRGNQNWHQTALMRLQLLYK